MRRLLFAIALLGLFVSSYLSFAYITGGPIICGKDGGCEAVRGSAYAHFFGVPTPVYGVIFYLILAILALLWEGERQAQLRLPLFLVTSSGVVVSIYLSYLEAFVIQAWCGWCIVSAVLAFLAFIVVWSKSRV